MLAHGAAGAVGSIVTQLARESGAYVIATGRAKDREAALDFGANDGRLRSRVGTVASIEDAVTALNPAARRSGKTVITVAR
ncbi:hypothetical protein [Microbacterium candidum]|uniref:Alcohol dehydrogenase-like C-terminal domain-containing protein n=1 Tax=Microbacterium candidum TaxID=3041922 RepID=A0ABT7N1A2_9MICO|nr:hypothetical protein [Microbacterium sp. ASV49]MDL9980441.1 hypothetical protein [Microbacterium sp. ASV49]